MRDVQGNYTILDSVYPGITANTFALSINKSHQVVGEVSFVNQGYIGGFLRDSSGTFTGLGYGVATGIDDPGIIIFSEFGGAGVLAKNANFTAFDVPGSVETNASGISSLDQIVGYYLDSSYTTYHGFLRR